MRDTDVEDDDDTNHGGFLHDDGGDDDDDDDDFQARPLVLPDKILGSFNRCN